MRLENRDLERAACLPARGGGEQRRGAGAHRATAHHHDVK
jgi:hypothetical protein